MDADWKELVDAADDGSLGDLDKGRGSDWKGGEYTPETADSKSLFDPVLDRSTSKRPSYRQWLDVLHRQRSVFLVAHGGWGWDPQEWVDPILDKTPAKDLKKLEARGCPPENIDAVVKIRKNYSLLRRFAGVVLGGGPDSVWIAKPLDPKSLHADITAFYSAGKTGIDQQLIDASSMCWELFEAWRIPSSGFEAVARMLEEEEKSRHTVTTLLSDPPAIGAAPSDPSEEPKTTPEGSTYVADVEAVAGSLGDETDPGESMVTKDRRGEKVEKAILQSADKAMVERLGHREFRESGTNPGLPPRVRCTYVRRTKLHGEWQCNHWSVYSSDRCEAHGGDLIDVEETKALLRNSQQKIFGASLAAVSTVVDIMTNSTNDGVRLRAAETILNRAGINEHTDISVTLGVDDMATAKPAGDVVRERLMQLAGLDKRQLDAVTKRSEEDAEKYAAIDAEVVEEGEVIMPDAHSDD